MAAQEFLYWTDDGSVAALRYGNWKATFLRQNAHGMHVWLQPFEELRAPTLVNLRMDPFELAQDIGMDYQRWYLEHMFMIAPAGAFVGQWLQSFRDFPPRQKPGSFNLDRVMEAVTKPPAANKAPSHGRLSGEFFVARTSRLAPVSRGDGSPFAGRAV